MLVLHILESVENESNLLSTYVEITDNAFWCKEYKKHKKQKMVIAASSQTTQQGEDSENLKVFIHLYSGVDKHRLPEAGISFLIRKFSTNIQIYE